MKNQITVLGCTLTKVTSEGYDVDRYGHPLGMICKSTTTRKWAATWNMVPAEGDKGYCYDSKEDAVQRLLDWEMETRTKK
jgi:hypothetical protein